MENLDTAEKIRKAFGENDALRDMGLITPPDVIRLDDIHYGDEEDQVLDVYMPKVRTGKLPVIVSVHGGGWVYGDKERYQFYCMNMAERGFAVINYTYRLMPEHPFPSALEDTQLVMEWLSKNISFLNLDPKHIFMMGDSAGAHYLSLYIGALTDDKGKKKFPFVHKTVDICAMALHCGMYQPKDPSTVKLLEAHLGSYTIDDLDATRYVNNSFPPVYMMTCADDFLKKQALILAAAMIEEKVPYTQRFYTNGREKLEHCYFLDLHHPLAEQTNSDTAHFFKQFIR